MPHDDHGDLPGASPALSRRAMLAALTEQREKLLAAIIRLTGLGRADAEDVLQEITYHLLDKNIVLDDPTKWFPYLKTTALNRVRQDIRAATRGDERIDREAHWLTPAELPDPAELVGREMVLLDVLADLATLPELEREVFLLRHFDNVKPAEIAERLGLGPRQVETKLRQAKQRLDRLHALRRETDTYVFLATLTGRVRRAASDATSVATTPVLHTIAVAAVTAFALVVTQGAASGQASPSSTADAATTYRVASPPPGRDVPRGSGPNGARPVVGAGRAAVSDPTRPSHDLIAPACVKLHRATSCIDVTRELPEPVPVDVDVLTITVLGISRTIRDGVSPICEHLPTNPVAECTRQGSPDRLVKSPPTPAAGGPSPWRSPYISPSPPSPSSRCPC